MFEQKSTIGHLRSKGIMTGLMQQHVAGTSQTVIGFAPKPKGKENEPYPAKPPEWEDYPHEKWCLAHHHGSAKASAAATSKNEIHKPPTPPSAAGPSGTHKRRV